MLPANAPFYKGERISREKNYSYWKWNVMNFRFGKAKSQGSRSARGAYASRWNQREFSDEQWKDFTTWWVMACIYLIRCNYNRHHRTYECFNGEAINWNQSSKHLRLSFEFVSSIYLRPMAVNESLNNEPILAEYAAAHPQNNCYIKSIVNHPERISEKLPIAINFSQHLQQINENLQRWSNLMKWAERGTEMQEKH